MAVKLICVCNGKPMKRIAGHTIACPIALKQYKEDKNLYWETLLAINSPNLLSFYRCAFCIAMFRGNGNLTKHLKDCHSETSGPDKAKNVIIVLQSGQLISSIVTMRLQAYPSNVFLFLLLCCTKYFPILENAFLNWDLLSDAVSTERIKEYLASFRRDDYPALNDVQKEMFLCRLKNTYQIEYQILLKKAIAMYKDLTKINYLKEAIHFLQTADIKDLK